MTSVSSLGVDDNPASNATRKADLAEKEANRRIQAAEARTHKAELEQEQNLSFIRDQFQKQFISEEQHQEALLEAQRMKGYENLRNLQRSQGEEINKVRQEGDTRMNQLRDYYRDTKYSTEVHGTQDLKELELNNEMNLESSKKVGVENLTQLNEEYLKNIANLANLYESKAAQLKLDQQNELERQKDMGHTANEMAVNRYQKQYEGLVASHEDQLKKLDDFANQQIREIRQQTADKLATYKTRQSDPFYKLMNLEPQLTENDREFILKLKVPEYEHKNLSASVRGENLVILGQRRNEEELDLGNGVTQGTASYQSFHQSFPLSWPVEPSKLSKEFHGDQVIIRVPKKNRYAAHQSNSAHPSQGGHEIAKFPREINEFYIDQKNKSELDKNFKKL